jgi:CRP/FNR family transcriptional regulator, cyclic AMP receptor protein
VQESVLGSVDLPEVVYDDGTQLFSEGDTRRELLILVSGAVRITKAGAHISVVDRPGSVLGEIGLLLDSPASATVTAVGECRCLRAEDPESFLRERPEFTLTLARTLARRLDLLTAYVADLRQQYADREDHLGVVADVLGVLMQHDGEPTEPPGSEREPDAPY